MTKGPSVEQDSVQDDKVDLESLPRAALLWLVSKCGICAYACTTVQKNVQELSGLMDAGQHGGCEF